MSSSKGGPRNGHSDRVTVSVRPVLVCLDVCRGTVHGWYTTLGLVVSLSTIYDTLGPFPWRLNVVPGPVPEISLIGNSTQGVYSSSVWIAHPFTPERSGSLVVYASGSPFSRATNSFIFTKYQCEWARRQVSLFAPVQYFAALKDVVFSVFVGDARP